MWKIKYYMFLLFLSAYSFAWESDVSCALPTERVGGQPLPKEEIKEVNFVFGFCNGTSQTFTSSECSIIQPTENEPCSISVYVVDTYGLVSTQVSGLEIKISNPKPPSNVSAVILDRK